MNPLEHSKIGVIAIIKKGDKYLLGLETKESPFKGKWRLLGGKVEEGETNEDALHRELMEEARIKIKIKKHIAEVKGDFNNFKIHIYLAEWASGRIVLKKDENESIKLFTRDEIKKLDIEHLSKDALTKEIGL